MRTSVWVDDSPKKPILSGLFRCVHGGIEVYRQDMLLEFSGAYKSVDRIVVFHGERKLADYVVKVNFGRPAGMSYSRHEEDYITISTMRAYIFIAFLAGPIHRLVSYGP